MRPETLEAALAWLATKDGLLQASRHFAAVEIVSETGDGAKLSHVPIIDGDIPAAIVAAVGEVWDQVNGKDQP